MITADKRLQLLKNFAALEAERSNMDETWRKIERFIMPLRGGEFDESDQSEQTIRWQRMEIFDNTAVVDADVLSASIHGSLTSPSIRWFSFKFADDELRKDPEAAKWIQQCTETVYQYLQDSNFDLEVQEGYLDLVGFGNTLVTLEMKGTYDDFQGFDFNCVPVREIYMDEDSEDQVYNLYRRLTWTLNQMVDKFTVDGLPKALQDQYNDDAYDNTTKHDLVFVIYTKNNAKKTNMGEKVVEALRPIGYCYLLKKDGSLLGKDGSYYEMPAYMPRWRKTSGSKYGYGPGHLAVSTAITLNKYYELDIRAAEKVIDPAHLVTENGLVSDIDTSSKGLTVVKDINASMKPYESTARFDISDSRMEDMRQQIHRVFKIDQLNLKDSPAMSATEAQIRYELMNRVIGPTLGQLKTNFFNPALQRAFNMIFRAGKFPDLPDILKKDGANKKFDVHYMGPMERAQKTDQISSIERWLGFIGQFGEVFPDMIDVPNQIKIAKDMADILDINMESVHSDAELTTIKKLKQQLAEAQGKLAQQQAQGDAMKATGEGMQAMENVGG